MIYSLSSNFVEIDTPDSLPLRKAVIFLLKKKQPKGEFSMRKNQSINKNCDFRMSKKENIKPYLKRRCQHRFKITQNQRLKIPHLIG